jgi:hypothetical protein
MPPTGETPCLYKNRGSRMLETAKCRGAQRSAVSLTALSTGRLPHATRLPPSRVRNGGQVLTPPLWIAERNLRRIAEEIDALIVPLRTRMQNSSHCFVDLKCGGI